MYICMKKYIQATFTPDIAIDYRMFEGTPFKCDTGVSYYNNFLVKEDLAYMQKEKNRTGSVRRMSPREYYRACADWGFSKYVPVSQLKQGRALDANRNAEYAELMESGVKFDMCYLNKADHQQEGLHRMMVAGDLYGWDKPFPVLVVSVYDWDIENRRKLIRAAQDFRDNGFKDICKWAATKISDWRKAPPEDFIDQYRNAISEYINNGVFTGFVDNINFEVDVQELDGWHQVYVYLTSYGDYEFPGYSNPYTTFLEDLYDMSGDTAATEDTSDTGLSDIDFLDLE